MVLCVLFSSFVFVKEEVRKKLLLKKMATASNDTLNHKNHYHYTICLEGLAVCTTMTLQCRHPLHPDNFLERKGNVFRRFFL
ncbi:hypothetical protein BT93_H2421 [Corymbia citriodora subsp. variegata]|nr:hypothetical protein BT93_H2421 [Corymbia citriodora subsp. variegata]